MKVLLAPLHFRTRFCRHCRRAFYALHPDKWLGTWEFESLPPLGAFDPARGFVPDFPGLLLFDEFVVDAEAADILRDRSRRAWLGMWPELVQAMQSEGALTTADVRDAASSLPHQRAAMLRADLRRPERWFDAFGYYEAVSARAEQLLGNDPRKAKAASWDFDPKARYGIKGIDGLGHYPEVVLSEGAAATHDAHRSLYGQVLQRLRSHLREVNACVIAANRLQVAPFVWAPYRRYLETKFASRPQISGQFKGAEAGREFFNVAFPAYRPTTVREFVRLRRDRRIVTLRSEIMRAKNEGELMDPHYPQRVLQEVLRIEKRNARMRRIIGWLSTAVGSIPLPALGLASSAIAEGVSTLIERRNKKSANWFYLISDGRGAT